MSAKGRGETMRADGHYETPDWATFALLKRLGDVVSPGETVLDAGMGSGAVAAALIKKVPGLTVVGVEKNKRLVNLARRRFRNCPNVHVVHADFLGAWNLPTAVRPHHAIYNPPFELTLQFAREAMKLVEYSVCSLGRVNWLGGGASPKVWLDWKRKGGPKPTTLARMEWNQENPCELLVLPRRPSFGRSASGSTTDATEYSWMIWGDVPDLQPGRWSIADPAVCRNLVKRRGAAT